MRIIGLKLTHLMALASKAGMPTNFTTRRNNPERDGVAAQAPLNSIFHHGCKTLQGLAVNDEHLRTPPCVTPLL